jgi:hypothetical protein
MVGMRKGSGWWARGKRNEIDGNEERIPGYSCFAVPPGSGIIGACPQDQGTIMEGDATACMSSLFLH